MGKTLKEEAVLAINRHWPTFDNDIKLSSGQLTGQLVNAVIEVLKSDNEEDRMFRKSLCQDKAVEVFVEITNERINYAKKRSFE